MSISVMLTISESIGWPKMGSNVEAISAKRRGTSSGFILIAGVPLHRAGAKLDVI